MPSWVRWGTRFLALIPCLWCTAVRAGTSAYVVGQTDARIARVDLDSGAVTPSVAVAGSSPNRLEVGPGGKLAAVANSGSDDVTLAQLRAGEVLGTVALPAGSNPWGVEIVGRRVFVTGLLTDRVYEIDAATMTVVRSAAVGRAPEGMAVSAGRLYVANTGFDFQTFQYDPGTVTVLDLEGLSPVATVPVSLNPQDCVRAPDGRVHVICTGDFFQVTGSVDVVDPEGDAVVASLPVAPGYPGGGAIGRDGAAYLNVTTPSFGSEVWCYDARTLAFVRDGSDPLLPSSHFFGALGLAPDGKLLVPDFSADLLLVEDPAAPGSPAAHLVGDGPIAVAVVDDPSHHASPDAIAGLLATVGEGAAKRIAFAPVAPNPSRGTVELAVRGPDGAAPSVTVFDVRGRRVRALGRRAMTSGTAVFAWDGRADDGSETGAGVYFARAESGEDAAVARVLRLR